MLAAFSHSPLNSTYTTDRSLFLKNRAGRKSKKDRRRRLLRASCHCLNPIHSNPIQSIRYTHDKTSRKKLTPCWPQRKEEMKGCQLNNIPRARYTYPTLPTPSIQLRNDERTEYIGDGCGQHRKGKERKGNEWSGSAP